VKEVATEAEEEEIDQTPVTREMDLMMKVSKLSRLAEIDQQEAPEADTEVEVIEEVTEEVKEATGEVVIEVVIEELKEEAKEEPAEEEVKDHQERVKTLLTSLVNYQESQLLSLNQRQLNRPRNER